MSARISAALEGDAMSSDFQHLRPRTSHLRAVESFLLRGGQQTARRNAWAAVVADRQRAKDRREAEREMDSLVSAVRGTAAEDAVRD